MVTRVGENPSTKDRQGAEARFQPGQSPAKNLRMRPRPFSISAAEVA